MITTTTGRGTRRRKKNIRRITTLHLEDVDIILYDFTLTKSGHLRKSIINMLIEKLKTLNLELPQRQTRCATHNPTEVGLHLDEDGALVNTSEEDESSHMSVQDNTSFDDFLNYLIPVSMCFLYYNKNGGFLMVSERIFQMFLILRNVSPSSRKHVLLTCYLFPNWITKVMENHTFFKYRSYSLKFFQVSLYA